MHSCNQLSACHLKLIWAVLVLGILRRMCQGDWVIACLGANLFVVLKAAHALRADLGSAIGLILILMLVVGAGHGE